MDDVGHAIQALACAACILGWRVRRIEGLKTDQTDRLLALDSSRGPEAEHADVLLVIEPIPITEERPVSVKLSDQLLADLCPPALGQPNTLSLEHQAWSVLAEVEEATRDSGSPHGNIEFQREGSLADPLESSASARMLVHQWRSAVAFDGNSGLSLKQTSRISGTLVSELTPTLCTAFPHQPRVHPVVYLHRIEGLEPGLAELVRKGAHEPALRAEIPRVEHWEKLPGCPDNLPVSPVNRIAPSPINYR